MLNGRQLHGLPVFCVGTWKELGRITDVVADGETGQIKGFTVSGGKMFPQKYFLPIQQIIELQLTGAQIRSTPPLKRLRKDLAGNTLFQQLGNPLLDHEGREKGTVSDIIVSNGKVCGLEISDGVLSDLKKGRQILAWENVRQHADTFFEIDD